MKKLFAVLLFVIATTLGAQDKPVEPKTVKADEQFIQQYNDAMALNRLVMRKEQELTILRSSLNEASVPLRQWTIAHKVENWSYDASTQTFTAPKIEAAKNDPKKQEKP